MLADRPRAIENTISMTSISCYRSLLKQMCGSGQSKAVTPSDNPHKHPSNPTAAGQPASNSIVTDKVSGADLFDRKGRETRLNPNVDEKIVLPQKKQPVLMNPPKEVVTKEGVSFEPVSVDRTQREDPEEKKKRLEKERQQMEEAINKKEKLKAASTQKKRVN